MLDLEKIKSSAGRSLFNSGIYYMPEIDSTNEYAKSLPEESDFLVLTDNQTKGLGRMGRTWESEKGKNITFTLKKHFEVEPGKVQAVNFYFSYFLLACIKNFIAKKYNHKKYFPGINIKWPNDILINSKKVSGLLIENPAGKNHFIIGVGINVNQEKFSSEFDHKATSLKNILGLDIDLNEFIIELLNVFAKNLNLITDKKYELIYGLWKRSNNIIGKEVYFQDGENMNKYGKIMDLLNDGGLLMKVDGEFKTFYSGEIKILQNREGSFKE